MTTHKALEDAARKATPGPWERIGVTRSIQATREKYSVSIASASWGNRYCPEKFSAEANAAYIALANPTYILSVLEELSTLKGRQRTEGAEEVCSGCARWLKDMDENDDECEGLFDIEGKYIRPCPITRPQG